MKNSKKDLLIIGFALFAMFFGAGNLIFPPYLGNMVGSKYLIATIGFVIAGAGMPFLSILACSKTNGNFEDMAGKVGRRFAIMCSVAIFLAIGPMLAIPRTAATTHELTIQPLLPFMPALLSMVLYFALNLLFVLRPSKAIDYIGQYLTPILLITLALLIIKGIVFPIGNIIDRNVPSVFSSSLIEGYQTMDALAGLMFATVITNSVRDKGYTGKDAMSMTIKSGLIAIIGLALVYGGLMYLGAQTSSIYSGEISKTALLLQISEKTFGKYGTMLVGIAMGLACFTTSVGLITAGATFFRDISNGKLSYNMNAIIISLASIAIGTFGVDKIVKVSVPILSIMYPVAITLTLITLAGSLAQRHSLIRNTVYTSLIFSILETMPSMGLNFVEGFISILPLSKLGFGWVIPTILVLILSLFIGNNDKQVNLFN